MHSEQTVAVVVDYQNVFMTAADVFGRNAPKQYSLIDPYRFCERLNAARNQAIGLRNWRKDLNLPTGVLWHVEAFRGLPNPQIDPDGYRRNMAQKEHWEREAAEHHVRLTVTHRTLKYHMRRSEEQWVPDLALPPEEKGIDVLCALAVTRLARSGDFDVVILASRDTDLIPAVQEAQRAGDVRIEGAKWFDPKNESTYGNLTLGPSQDLWTTPMDENDYEHSLDLNDYE